MKNHPQLTKVTGSYVHCLQEKTTEIVAEYNNVRVSTPQFKQFVRTIVMSANTKPLEQKSVATKRFLTSLERQTSKDGILMLVYNSQLNGDGLGVI